MILKLRKQLFNSPPFLTLLVVLPLVGFFLYATIYNTAFFLILVAGLLATVGYLVILRSRFFHQMTDLELRLQDIREEGNMLDLEIRKEQEYIDTFREKILNTSQLKSFTEKLSRHLILEETINVITRDTTSFFKDRDATIALFLFQSKTGELGLVASERRGAGAHVRNQRGDLFDRWIMKTMQSLLVRNARSDYRFNPDDIDAHSLRSIRSLMGVPLIVGDKVLGLLRFDSTKENEFDTEDLRFLRTIGDLSAMAIENAQLYNRVQELAIRDGLTDLYLRRFLFDKMDVEIRRHRRMNRSFVFMMLDIDHFKKYNDRFGHVAGDMVLKMVADILADMFDGPGQLVARYGGEEFAVLLPDSTESQALKLAEQARELIEQKTLILRREKTRVTASIGMATYPKDAQDKEALIDRADQALYRAKSNGRNQVVAI